MGMVALFLVFGFWCFDFKCKKKYFVYGYLACMYVRALHASLMPREVRRGCQISWN